MKIVIISDYMEGGGAEIYGHNLLEILRGRGHDVIFLYFEHKSRKPQDENTYREIHPDIVDKKIGKFLFRHKLYCRIKKEIDSFCPDLIILNSEYNYFYSVRKAVKKYKTWNIVHDHRPICHNGNCTHSDYVVCKGYKTENCFRNCHKDYSYLHILLKLINTYRIERINKKVIDLNIVPSKALAKKCESFGYRTVCIHNPLIWKEATEIILKEDFIYVGRINRDKGIFDFGRHLIEYNRNHKKKVNLKVYGEVEVGSEKKLQKLCESVHISYGGVLDQTEIISKMASAWAVVVPSLGLENYPTVVLEAMASKTVVLGSNRGGIVEMLSENRGILFDPLDKTAVIKAIERVKSLSREEYRCIIRRAEKYLYDNNTMEVYGERLENLLLHETEKIAR